MQHERQRDLARVDAALETWIPILHDPGHPKVKMASETARWLMVRRARLLGTDHAAQGSGVNILNQVTNVVPSAPAVPDIDFSTWRDVEVAAFKYLTEKAEGRDPAGSLEDVLSRQSCVAPSVILVEEAA